MTADPLIVGLDAEPGLPVAENPATAPLAPAKEKISHRLGATLVSQVIQLVCSAFTVSLVPRALGPIDFGNFNFIYSAAASIRSFTDLGTRHMFFTYSSKIARSGALTKLYMLWLVLQLAFSLALIGTAHLFHFDAWLWPQQHLHLIILVTALEGLTSAALCLQQLGDSKGRTVYTQAIVTSVALVDAVCIVLLLLVHQLNLYSYIGLLYLIALSSLTALSVYLLWQHSEFCWEGSVRGRIREHFQSWRTYSSPLIVLGLYFTAYNFLDTYLIQRLYGSQEQAYLALSSRISSFIAIFTTASLSVYWREIAHHLGANDLSSAKQVYLRFSRLLFFPTLCLSCWLAMNAPYVVRVLAGQAYVAAVPVLQIMAFYPLEQALSQISSIGLLASERTALYRNFGIGLSIPALCMTYLFLAPSTALIPGLHLGASGVALKMAGYGLLSVQVYEFSNARFFKFSFGSLLAERFRVLCLVAVVYAVVWGASHVFQKAVGSMEKALEILMFNSVLYFSIFGAVFLYNPVLLGWTVSDRDRAFTFLRKLLRRGRAS